MDWFSEEGKEAFPTALAAAGPVLSGLFLQLANCSMSKSQSLPSVVQSKLQSAEIKKKKSQYKVTSLRYRHIPIEVGKILKNLNGAAIGKRWWRYRAERRIQLSELQSLIQFHLHILQAGKLHRKMKQVVQEQTVVSAEPGQEARYFFNLYIAAAKKKTNGQGVLKSYHVEWAAHVFENSSAGQGKGFLPALPSPSAISSPGCKNCKVLRKPTSVEERNQR